MNIRFKEYLHQNRAVLLLALKCYGAIHLVKARAHKDKLFLDKSGMTIIISGSHLAYARDVIRNFEFYYTSTESDPKDYSLPADHMLKGFSDFMIRTPSLPEPISTINQYCEFLEIREGSVVIDLGAYSGLTSIVFGRLAGLSGKVIAVEPDLTNGECSEINFSRFKAKYGYAPTLIKKALWNETTTVLFSDEANLGSAVTELLPRALGASRTVETVTLSDIANLFSLEAVDAIKADVEGAEYFAFSDSEFFSKFKPRIVFEPANERSEFTRASNITALLESYGYVCEYIAQIGSQLPLICCKYVQE